MYIQNLYLLFHLKKLIYELYEIWHGDKSNMQTFHKAMLCIKIYKYKYKNIV
jgi:hypothetical protein